MEPERKENDRMRREEEGDRRKEAGRGRGGRRGEGARETRLSSFPLAQDRALLLPQGSALCLGEEPRSTLAHVAFCPHLR